MLCNQKALWALTKAGQCKDGYSGFVVASQSTAGPWTSYACFRTKIVVCYVQRFDVWPVRCEKGEKGEGGHWPLKFLIVGINASRRAAELGR